MRILVIGIVVAAVGIIGCLAFGAGNRRQFFFSWLVSFLFFLSLVIGELYFVLIQYAVLLLPDDRQEPLDQAMAFYDWAVQPGRWHLPLHWRGGAASIGS